MSDLLPAGADLATVITWAKAYPTRHGRKPRLRVSVSGGRTSARMAQLIKQHLSEHFELLFQFANTSREHPDTLRFVNDVDHHLGLDLVWVEAVVHHGERKSSTHRVVTFETAHRDGEVFEEVVAKYGLPNRTFKLCTRELKLNPMKSYAASIGWEEGTYLTAIGIRADEGRRVADSALAQSIVYPLTHWWPHDKQDVLDYWEDFAWDLTIAEHEGNCMECHQKSDKKLQLLHRQRPEVFEFPIKLDNLYSKVGKNNRPGPRRRYRLERSTEQLIAQFQALDFDPSKMITDGGCSESCELYETVEVGRG